MNKNRPNLFDYATSELSQDAMICYLLKWAEKSNSEAFEHRIGKKLLDAFFDKHSSIAKPQNYNTIEIITQYKHIDVLCIVNKRYHIIIEDKTNTTHHSNQLDKYFKTIKKEVDEENILRIYYKTGEEYNHQKLSDYKFFSVEDILKVFGEGELSNQIISDYRDKLLDLLRFSNYRELPIKDWNTNSWIAFVRELKIDCFGEKITGAFGSNNGIYFNYTKIEKDKVGFYLRLSFDRNAIEFKLENEGSEITEKLADEYYELINTKFPKQITNGRKGSSKKTKVIAVLKSPLLIESDDNLLDFLKTKSRIKEIIEVHNDLTKNLQLNNFVK